MEHSSKVSAEPCKMDDPAGKFTQIKIKFTLTFGQWDGLPNITAISFKAAHFNNVRSSSSGF